MPNLQDLTGIWKNLREVDLRPLAAAAQAEVRLALIGAEGVGRHTLASQLESDATRRQVRTWTSVPILDLEEVEAASGAELVILVVDAAAPDLALEKRTASRLSSQARPESIGRGLLVFYNKLDTVTVASAVDVNSDWGRAAVVYGSALDRSFLGGEFARSLFALVPDRLLALARQYPLCRPAVAEHLINETCNANALYALTTGLAEIIPVLDLPFNVADMVVLTKAQAMLVYKLGLAFGLSTRWQDHLAEFGGVIGGGFVWRQLARSLVGLIPVWGIVPKVAVAYAGTYVVGHAVLQWYLTGRRLTRQQMRELYAQAFTQGKTFAAGLLGKAPRARRPRGLAGLSFPRRPRLALSAPRETALVRKGAVQVCGECGKRNEREARFCSRCGTRLATDAEGK